MLVWNNGVTLSLSTILCFMLGLEWYEMMRLELLAVIICWLATLL